MALTLRSKTIKPALLPLGAHCTHRLVIHRRPEAGDRLLTRGQVLSGRASRTGTLVVIRYSTVDRNGRPLTTTDYGSGLRGVPPAGHPDAAIPPPPPGPPPPPAADRWRPTG